MCQHLLAPNSFVCTRSNPPIIAVSSLSNPAEPRLLVIPSPTNPSSLRSLFLKLFIGDHVPNLIEGAVGL
jgi:hypothetical protein